MTMVFNLSELMVGGFGVSDPVTGGVETREGSASDSDLLLNERHQLSIPTAFPSRSHERVVRLREPCEGIYTIVTICTYL